MKRRRLRSRLAPLPHPIRHHGRRDHGGRVETRLGLGGVRRGVGGLGALGCVPLDTHLYVERGAGSPRLALIDLHRARRLGRVPDRLVARDLGALDATTPADLASTRDRLRVFARAVPSRGGPDARARARRILALVEFRAERIRRWRREKAKG
jgi:hypothetical protein